MKRLGVLLTTSPELEDGHTVRRIVEAARRQGVAVDIFLMCDGVYHLLDRGFLALAGEGVRIRCCSKNATERGLEAVEDLPGVEWGSQYDLAHISEECDRVISFN